MQVLFFFKLFTKVILVMLNNPEFVCVHVQVPQFLLEDAVERGFGAQCQIICTQPRRISAISGKEHLYLLLSFVCVRALILLASKVSYQVISNVLFVSIF